MTSPQANQSDRLDRIEAILADVAVIQQRTAQQQAADRAEWQGRLSRIEASQERTQALQQENATAIAESRQQLQASIADVVNMIAQQSAAADERLTRTEHLCDSNARAIEAWAEQQIGDRDASILAEFDLHSDISDFRVAVEAGFNQVGQAIQTLTNAIFSLLQQVADLQRRAG